MKTTINLFVSCEDAKLICDKNQYGEASTLELLQLNLRLAYCKATRAYSKNNTKLTKTINKSNIKTLEASQKEEIKKKLKEKLTT